MPKLNIFNFAGTKQAKMHSVSHIYRVWILAIAMAVLPSLCPAQNADIPARNADSLAQKGKWTGNATIVGGFNYAKSPWKEIIADLKHESADMRLNLKYIKNDFIATVQLNTAWDNHLKATEGLNMVNVDELSVNCTEIKLMSSRYNLRATFQWKKPRTIYNSYCYLNYSFSHNRKDNFTIRIEEMNLDLRGEDNNSYTFSSGSGFNMTRKLDGGRKLFAESEFSYTNTDSYTEWAFFSLNEGSPDRIYRKTPLSIGLRSESRAYLGQSNTFNVKNFNTEAGGIFSITYDNDKYRGAYRADVSDKNSWVDSLKLRETFRYAVITLNPYVKADYSYKFLKLKMDAKLQFYADKLTNKDAHQSYDFKAPALTGNTEAEFRIADNHYIAVGLQTSVRRPTYTQMCWYSREGDFPGQHIVGNPDLKVSRSYRNILSYRIRFRKFSSELSSSFTRNLKEVEQTFYEDYIGERKVKFFTWVNTAYSKVWNTAYFLRYDTKRLFLRTDVGYYDYKGQAKTAGTVRKDHYWTAKASGGFNFNRGWSVSSDISYRSKMSRAYYTYDKYYSLNCRIEKKFGRHTIFLEGRDLLEQKITNSYTSEDEQNAWVEVNYNNRRFFLIGYTFSF